MPLQLPEPDDNAKALSLALQQQIKDIIISQGKISFHDFMQKALYEPGLGYYSAGCLKLGEAGDFITAPEISPLFGATVANGISQLAPELQQADWFELGAGSGKLAASILQYLDQQNRLPNHYFILEVSADLKQRQQQYLQTQLASHIFCRITWLDQLPKQFNGIIIANEVLDALAVHRFKISERGPLEAYLRLNNTEHLEEFFATATSDYLNERISNLNLPENYLSEINLQQEALLKSLNDLLQQGIIIFIDYGFSAKEYYHPQRDQGTLMCHYQHRAHGDFLFWPGLQDITAHVDFTALATCAIQQGLSLVNFNTQSAWLLQADILALAKESLSSFDEKQQILAMQALKKLITPEEMGELFKVIIFGKSVDASAADDMRHRL